MRHEPQPQLVLQQGEQAPVGQGLDPRGPQGPSGRSRNFFNQGTPDLHGQDHHLPLTMIDLTFVNIANFWFPSEHFDMFTVSA